MSRPTDYSPDTDAQICERIAAGESLSAICRDEAMPHRDTVYTWMGKNQAFADRYARAVEDRAETLAAEILAIADDGKNDYGFKESEDKDGAGATPVFLAENVQRSKLRVEARKWIASKLFPKKFGDYQRIDAQVSVSIADRLKEARERAKNR